MTDFPVTISARLRLLRERAGLTASELAARAGISRPVYSRIESGQRRPSWPTLRKLADALGCSLAEFDGCR